MFRILVLLNTPWAGDNSNGNTFTNLFSGLPGVEIANIYCRYGMPDQNGIVSRYYQITEGDLIHGKPGRSFSSSDIPEKETKAHEEDAKQKYDFFRKHRWMVFFWARELIWKLGRWSTPELRQFIDEFHPDLLYLPMFDAGYMQDIAAFLCDYTKARCITCFTDDIYSLKQFSLSPLYWIDRFWKRRKLRRIVGKSEFVHVISEKQKEEYARYFRKECRIFRKSMDFSEKQRKSPTIHRPLQYVYTGHMGSNRWKALCALGRVLDRIGGELFVYSATPLSGKMKESFGRIRSTHIMGQIPYTECCIKQQDADILVLAEAVTLKNQRLIRLSLSTKIVEYMHTGNCILAIGPKDQAGMEYLDKNRAALCVYDLNELEEKLRTLDEDTLRQYGENAWKLGEKNHDIRTVKKAFLKDLQGDCQ